jgi:hypothetical protein
MLPSPLLLQTPNATTAPTQQQPAAAGHPVYPCGGTLCASRPAGKAVLRTNATGSHAATKEGRYLAAAAPPANCCPAITDQYPPAPA